MKSKTLLFVLVNLVVGPLAAQEPEVKPLMSKDLADTSGFLAKDKGAPILVLAK